MLSLISSLVIWAIIALIISSVLVLLLLAVVHALYPGYLQNALLVTSAWVIPLFIVLLIQSFLCCGAISFKGELAAIGQNAQEVMGGPGDDVSGDAGFYLDRAEKLLDENFPMASGKLKESLRQGMEAADSFVSAILMALDGYIFRRIAWGIGMLVVVGGILFFNAGKDRSQREYLRRRSMMDL